MKSDLTARARAGDQEAFGELVGPYHYELQVHRYRMLGSAQDAEDACRRRCWPHGAGLATSRKRAVEPDACLQRTPTSSGLDADGPGSGQGHHGRPPDLSRTAEADPARRCLVA